jgi:hypothetical protein
MRRETRATRVTRAEANSQDATRRASSSSEGESA